MKTLVLTINLFYATITTVTVFVWISADASKQLSESVNAVGNKKTDLFYPKKKSRKP